MPVRPRRTITGMSAVLLPFGPDGGVDWPAFERHLLRTAAAGLVPAVNMDTGWVHLLDEDSRRQVVSRTATALDGAAFVAGAFVDDAPGDDLDLDGYRRECALVADHGGTPVVFPSHGLAALDGEGVVAAHRELARGCDRFFAFELSPAFSPAGRLWDLDVFAALLDVPACVGAKHSSLRRVPEWERLQLRDERRPDFVLLTGNDLAIDMVIYGSDYLLGLSTFAPDAFARRDACWAAGDPAFWELNDLLQYLGRLTFRPPVPAYRHSAAQFLCVRGWLDHDATPEGAPRRPDSDRELLADIARALEEAV